MEADALSTALMVLGPEAGFELAERERIAAFFIARNAKGFAELVTRGFAPYLIA
jgi:thiamine biosynthesis lipoprotein